MHLLTLLFILRLFMMDMYIIIIIVYFSCYVYLNSIRIPEILGIFCTVKNEIIFNFLIPMLGPNIFVNVDTIMVSIMS